MLEISGLHIYQKSMHYELQLNTQAFAFPSQGIKKNPKQQRKTTLTAIQ